MGRFKQVGLMFASMLGAWASAFACLSAAADGHVPWPKLGVFLFFILSTLALAVKVDRS